ncbi:MULTISPECIES: acyl carrier protein [Burkholderia]|jgi:acyl carrier protein|uniref:Acyl carrier protein n=2 Tax=Burkholderia gladioli TaxID=28095 RepID=A0AAP2NJ84_BURGA|nr:MULTISPECIES: acyl carrier protein [Burkholderia]AEA64398.1 putative acyl carrier protein [Burkholderia gladioli BSR3]AJW94899.1 phosphopantetheine attachment site family protein [Burkholderia gladioli]ASD81603.1 acyl carrier protein [Burkholderia gladioli pv. gladioli]AWY51858.1 acyl carrier protein [Burkholderia gladioli pv. gladioli]AYQ91249.1 acyl carrier protein [Burkholderia gladioli]
MSANQATNTLDILAKEVAKIINADQVDTHVGIGTLGIDSLNIVELIVFCEQLYGSVDPEQINLTQDTTLAELDSRLIAQQVA